MSNVPEFVIWIIEKTLSDGSSVFNVDFNGAELECVNEDAAEELANSIADAINENTNNTAGVMR